MNSIEIAFADELDKLASPGAPKGHPKYKDFKKNKVNLTPDERALVMGRKATWNFHFGRDGKRQKTPAVSKAVIGDKTWYATYTHRAINYATSVRGAISRYHRFIKGTA
jgi:hypothetical protein